MKQEANSTKLLATIGILVKLQKEIDEAGEFGEKYEYARDTLFEAFDHLAEYGKRAKLDVHARTVCERDGATLHVRWTKDGTEVVHTSKGEQTVVEDEHEFEGCLGSIVVDNFEWMWGEMVEGLVAAVRRLGMEPHEFSDEPRPKRLELPEDPKERGLALMHLVWPVLAAHRVDDDDTVLLCTTLLAAAALNSPNPELMKWVKSRVDNVSASVSATRRN